MVHFVLCSCNTVITLLVKWLEIDGRQCLFFLENFPLGVLTKILTLKNEQKHARILLLI